MQNMKVEGHPSFVRTGVAIVNTDVDAYQEFIRINKEKIQLESRVQSLENKLDTILGLLERKYGNNQ